VLYKVTPMMTPPVKVKPPRDPDAPKQPRKRRKSAVYDADGNEVLITMMCLKCRSMKPLAMFGLRKMADGAIRNQPWCRTCRSGASSGKKREKKSEVVETVEAVATASLPPPPVMVPVEAAAPAPMDAVVEHDDAPPDVEETAAEPEATAAALEPAAP